MHSLRYDDPNDGDIRWVIHYNSDYSGMAIIQKINKSVGVPIEECEVPCMVLINWVGYKIQMDVKSEIDNMSGEAFLRKIVKF